MWSPPTRNFCWPPKRTRSSAGSLNEADLVLPDGIGVVYSAKILGTPLKERVPGIDFAERHAGRPGPDGRAALSAGGQARRGRGGRPPHPAPATPLIVLCGTHDGYFKDEQASAARGRPPPSPTCCSSAWAPPSRRSGWPSAARHTGAKLAIGLGGALDVFAGNVERAPESWQKLGLEWAYRLKKEPKRIGRMAKLPLVLVKAAGQRLSGKRGKAEHDRQADRVRGHRRLGQVHPVPNSCATGWSAGAGPSGGWCSPSMSSPPPP